MVESVGLIIEIMIGDETNRKAFVTYKGDQTHHQDSEGIIHDSKNGEHHRETFFSKYIFSQDHKIISKQFLFTGMYWALIGGLLSVIFRLQLGFPNQAF